MWVVACEGEVYPVSCTSELELETVRMCPAASAAACAPIGRFAHNVELFSSKTKTFFVFFFLFFRDCTFFLSVSV